MKTESITDALTGIWHYPLFSLGEGVAITPSQIVLSLMIALIGLLLARLLARIVVRNLINARVDADAASSLGKIIFYTLALVVFLTALRILNIPITALTFLSGAVAIAIGFGAQNILNNFISGWILMSEQPVRRGDFVEIDDFKGVVESIGNRSTRIRRVDGVHVLVPNSQLLERTLVNWTLIDKDVRTIVRVGVAYGSPTRKVESLIQQAIDENKDVKIKPAPLIVFEDFGDNSLVFDAYVWCEVVGERDLRIVRSNLRHRITELFNENDITIAFPQRDVHLDTSRPLEINLKDSRTNNNSEQEMTEHE